MLTPIRIFEGAFGGATVFSNPGREPSVSLCELLFDIAIEFISPAAVRSALKRSKGDGYRMRKDAEEKSAKRKELRKRGDDDLAVSKVFA